MNKLIVNVKQNRKENKKKNSYLNLKLGIWDMSISLSFYVIINHDF